MSQALENEEDKEMEHVEDMEPVESDDPQDGGTPNDGGFDTKSDNKPSVETDSDVEITGLTEEDTAPAPNWAQQLRRQYRDMAREKTRLEKELQKHQKPIEKPTLQECNYDTDAYEQKLEEWFSHKNKQKKEDTAWQEKLSSYAQQKQQSSLPGFEDAEKLVLETMSEAQQALILKSAKNPASLVYILGKNPNLANKLASFEDHVEFVYEIARLEGAMKMQKKAAAPEKRVSGSSKGQASTELERLRQEAEKTGDYTKVIAYKRNAKKG